MLDARPIIEVWDGSPVWRGVYAEVPSPQVLHGLIDHHRDQMAEIAGELSLAHQRW